MFTFLHAADIHLDSPLRGLSRYQGAPLKALRGATRRALENLVDLAIERKVAFVLIAGDLYDGDWTDYNTGQFLVQQMARLGAAGIRVVAISGNHDAGSKLTRHLNLPSNMRMLSVDRPETVLLDEFGVAVHGQGFAQQAVSVDLSLDYPEPRPHAFNIGLLHTSADGREGHATYAPSSIEGLRQRGYDYWALGHIHKREVLSEQPYIVFSGNLQGRHIREQGSKGASLVRVEDHKIVAVEHVGLDLVRWEYLSIDLGDISAGDGMLATVATKMQEACRQAEGRMLAARLELNCGPELYAIVAADLERWVQEVRSLAIQSQDEVWIEKVILKSRGDFNLERASDELEVLGSILEGLSGLRSSGDEVAGLAKEIFSTLDSKLPRQWKAGDEPLSLLSPDFLQDLLQETGLFLQARLSRESGS